MRNSEEYHMAEGLEMLGTVVADEYGKISYCDILED